jgi:hypothetical protein
MVMTHGSITAEGAWHLKVNAIILRRWPQECGEEDTAAIPRNDWLGPEKERLCRLRQEKKRLQVECEILGKLRPSLPKSGAKVYLYRPTARAMADGDAACHMDGSRSGF